MINPNSIRKIPPPLTKCVDCGCCYADLYAGDDPICWACDADETCKGKLRAQPSPSQPKPVAQLAPSIQEKPMAVAAVHPHNKKRISEEVRSAILRESASVSNMDLQRKYGVSNVTISQMRRKAGIVLVKGPRAKGGPKPAGTTVDFVKANAEKIRDAANYAVKKSSPAKTPAPQPVVALEPIEVTVVLNFSPSQLDAIWALLPTDVKGIAITAALQAKVDAA